MARINILKYILDLDDYLLKAQTEMDDPGAFEDIKQNLIDEYYRDIEQLVKEGLLMPKWVFEALPKDKQWHFLKHHGDKFL